MKKYLLSAAVIGSLLSPAQSADEAIQLSRDSLTLAFVLVIAADAIVSQHAELPILTPGTTSLDTSSKHEPLYTELFTEPQKEKPIKNLHFKQPNRGPNAPGKKQAHR